MTAPSNQPVGDRIPHNTLIENLIWALHNGYVPADDVVRGRYEWERHGNPEQWIDVRWDKATIQLHHEAYVEAERIRRRTDRIKARIWGEIEGQL